MMNAIEGALAAVSMLPPVYCAAGYFRRLLAPSCDDTPSHEPYHVVTRSVESSETGKLMEYTVIRRAKP